MGDRERGAGDCAAEGGDQEHGDDVRETRRWRKQLMVTMRRRNSVVHINARRGNAMAGIMRLVRQEALKTSCGAVRDVMFTTGADAA